jgi:2-dehydropantoate 2-reductase
MKILVYGAGNIGSLYAARLNETGHDVSILARGQRLARIREHGIELENVVSGEKTTSQIITVEQLDPEDAYDLVLVVLPKNHVSEVLPKLAENRHTPSVMFMVNNAAGPREMIEALGADRVLLGFPGAAGVAEGGVIRYLITSAREQPTTIGEVDDRRSSRIQEIADAFEGAGFPVAICSNMDAWLKTHVAEISPTANALYMAGGDPGRLARTRDAMLLMLRGIREAYRVLRANGIPITPAHHRVFEWLPEPILLAVMRRMVKSDTTTIKIGHAQGAREEMKLMDHELRALAKKTSVPTPAMDRLTQYLDPKVEPLADGSAEIPLNWSWVWIVLPVLAVLAYLLSLLLR